MIEIRNLNSSKTEDGNRITVGDLGATAGTFVCVQEGEGNAAKATFSFFGNQYDMNGPLTFEIVGEWELAEVAEVLKVVSQNN